MGVWGVFGVCGCRCGRVGVLKKAREGPLFLICGGFDVLWYGGFGWVLFVALKPNFHVVG